MSSGKRRELLRIVLKLEVKSVLREMQLCVSRGSFALNVLQKCGILARLIRNVKRMRCSNANIGVQCVWGAVCRDREL